MQWIWALLAGVFLVSAGLLQSTVDATSEEMNLNPPENVVAENQPGLALLNVMPGGLRAPAVNYLWIRANDLKEEGRFYDAYQLASLICHLQPRSPGVWYFHAWNMAWNIATAVHTPQKRWHWVSNGMALLRDQGIPLNPDSIYLYKELSWIFMSKIGGDTDMLHRALKRRWATEMHRIFGAPVLGSTDEAIERFRSIVAAPLDRDPNRPREAGNFQTDVLEERLLAQQPRTAQYVAALREAGIEIDGSLLDAWHRWSDDPRVTQSLAVGARKPPRSDAQKALSRLINDPAFLVEREALLNWVRSQILWNHYKMDPQFMLSMMERHDVPLDWRLPWPHGMYWAALGLQKCDVPDITQATPLNTNRIELSCLKQMTTYGRLTLEIDPARPEEPRMHMSYDPRYIQATHRQFMEVIEEFRRIEARKEGHEIAMKDTQFAAGHVGYLREAMLMLVVAGREPQANEYFRWIVDNYKYDDDAWWKVDTAEEHLTLWFQAHTMLTPAQAQKAVDVALGRALANLAQGDEQAYSRIISQYAYKIYAQFQQGLPERTRMPPFYQLQARVLAQLLAYPRNLGYALSLDQRSVLWQKASLLKVQVGPNASFSLLSTIHDATADFLRRLCQQRGLDFEAMFPKPEDLDAYRAWRREQFNRYQEYLRQNQQGPARP
jgi:hypothetical protein